MIMPVEERRESGQQRDRGEGYRSSDQPHTEPLETRTLDLGEKRFFLDLKENHRGRLVKVTERTPFQRSFVVIDANDLPAIIEALQELLVAHQQIPEGGGY